MHNHVENLYAVERRPNGRVRLAWAFVDPDGNHTYRTEREFTLKEIRTLLSGNLIALGPFGQSYSICNESRLIMWHDYLKHWPEFK
jgi:hypothetical protein